MILDIIIDLQNRGFTSDFNLLGNRLFWAQTKSFFNIEQFDILEIHSLDDEYDSNKETVVYAIECLNNTVKGILFDNTHNINPLSSKIKKFWKQL